MSAPELFIIAADLTQMQVNANIDESDVGRMRPGEGGQLHASTPIRPRRSAARSSRCA